MVELYPVKKTKLAEFRKGICWFCQTSCERFRYTHEECILDYFRKTRRGQVIKI